MAQALDLYVNGSLNFFNQRTTVAVSYTHLDQGNKGTDVKSEQSAPAGWFVRNRKLTFHLVID